MRVDRFAACIDIKRDRRIDATREKTNPVKFIPLGRVIKNSPIPVTFHFPSPLGRGRIIAARYSRGRNNAGDCTGDDEGVVPKVRRSCEATQTYDEMGRKQRRGQTSRSRERKNNRQREGKEDERAVLGAMRGAGKA